jgi:hypothetical protein
LEQKAKVIIDESKDSLRAMSVSFQKIEEKRTKDEVLKVL